MASSGVIQGSFPNGLPRFDRGPAVAQPLAGRPAWVQQAVARAAPSPPIQRHAASPRIAEARDAVQVPPHLASFVAAGGQPLPQAVRQTMEAAFGARFDAVRIHVGREAASIGAVAFTAGDHLYFSPGSYNPETAKGRQLLGHELMHVVQQRAGRVRNPFGAGVAVVRDHGLEAEADRMAARAASQFPIQRLIRRGADREMQTLNLADVLIGGRDFGTTPVSLNHVTFPRPRAAQAAALAIARPVWSSRQLATGGVAVRLRSESTNSVSSQVHLPRTGAWTGQMNLLSLAQLLEGLRYGAGTTIPDSFIGSDGGSAATLEVHGLPDDARFAAQVRNHELVHVGDIDRVIDTVLKPWDDRMHQAFVDGTEVEGRTATEAKANFYARIGGTPEEIGTRFYEELKRLGDAYHRTPRGASPSITRVEPSRSTFLRNITVKVYYSHPLST